MSSIVNVDDKLDPKYVSSSFELFEALPQAVPVTTTAPEEVSKSNSSKRSSEVLSTITSIAFYAMIGCLIRIALDYLFGGNIFQIESSNFVILVSFTANMFGCFVLGALFFENKPTSLLYIGLTTGLCGSITTYSKFNQQVSLLLLNKAISGSYQIQPVVGIYALLVSILAFVASYLVGKNVLIIKKSYLLVHKRLSAFSYFGSMIFIFIFLSFAVVLGIFYENDDVANIFFAVLLAPFGAIIRWVLSNKVPKFSFEKYSIWNCIPTGTLTANILGSFLIALIYVIDNTYLKKGNNLPYLYGIKTGFLACLTTISTFIGEIVVLYHQQPNKAYFYLFISLFTSILLATLVNSITYICI